VVNLNLKGPFRLALLVAERMRADGGGSIINVTSLSAVRPEPRALPYAAAKAGLEVVTAGLAQAYAPTVRVNSIRPGSFATDVIRHWPPEVRERYASGVALRRLGDPAEITGAALYLASDASSFTTGSTISVDGGPA
jgi:NAD(P)-dependent dehydrogenase (short-subunit alcohol dehydrogenase family)